MLLRLRIIVCTASTLSFRPRCARPFVLEWEDPSRSRVAARAVGWEPPGARFRTLNGTDPRESVPDTQPKYAFISFRR